MELRPGANDVRTLAPGVYLVREAQAQKSLGFGLTLGSRPKRRIATEGSRGPVTEGGICAKVKVKAKVKNAVLRIST